VPGLIDNAARRAEAEGLDIAFEVPPNFRPETLTNPQSPPHRHPTKTDSNIEGRANRPD
jgi:hypothetical protein